MFKTGINKNLSVRHQVKPLRKPFFNKGSGGFFSESKETSAFFSAKGNMPHSNDSNPIQRQEQPESPVQNENEKVPAQGPLNKPSRAAVCVKDPMFPDFGCFATQLKLDVDENLVNNAHQFVRVATLFPGNNEMMWNTFLRYGLGVNLLETTFGFSGVNKKWGTILSYGAGVGMKAYQFSQNGELKLDLPIPLGKDTALEIKLDLKTDPHSIGNIKDADTSIGIIRRF